MFRKKRIHILWIINDEYTNNFITLYREARKRSDFRITLVAAPHEAPYGFGALSLGEVAAFLKKHKLRYLRASAKKTVDLKKLEPDFIFTTTPYDEYLPEAYRSEILAGIAPLCSVHYGAIMVDACQMSKRDGYGYENPYLERASLVFWPGSYGYGGQEKDRISGYLKMDEHLHYGRKPDFSQWRVGAGLRIIWKPRWTLTTSDSRFQMVLEGMEALLERFPELDVIMLEHPFLRDKIRASVHGAEWERQLEHLENKGNFRTYDSEDYLDVLLSADIFMGAHSSSLAEFALTGKPIIYLKTDAVMNSLGVLLLSGSYEADSMEEIEAVIGELLEGRDPLYEKRQSVSRWSFQPPEGKSVAHYILDILKEEYEKTSMAL